MVELFIKGGIFMYPILLCSITAVAIFLERVWNLRRASVVPEDFVNEIETLVAGRRIPEAMMRCRRNKSSMARILLVGIKNFGKRREIIRGINWSIIIFFISMFIVMQSVWNVGLIQLLASYLPPLTHTDSSFTILNILGASVGLSQVMSNVPFVAAYVNLMNSLGFNSLDTKAWIALAGGWTLAGNLTILGAASTIIILEVAEEKGHSFSFYEYLKIGSIVTLANIAVLGLWLILI